MNLEKNINLSNVLKLLNVLFFYHIRTLQDVRLHHKKTSSYWFPNNSVKYYFRSQFNRYKIPIYTINVFFNLWL